MKVTLVNYTGETFSPTAAGAAISMWLWEVCLAARRAGVEPLVISRLSDAPGYDWERTAFVPFPATPKSRALSLLLRAERKVTGWNFLRQRTYVRRVARRIHDAHMDDGLVVLHNDPEMAIYFRRLLPKARIVLLFHNSNHYMRSAFRGNLVQSTNLLLAVSGAAAREIERAYGLPAGIVKTIYNGVDLEQFKPIGNQDGATPVINFAGRIRHDKAPDLVLKAALVASEYTKKFAVQLLGTTQLPDGHVDDYEREIATLIQNLETRGISVRRAGYVDRRQVADEFRKATIHVTPSRVQEAFGLATVEAMASGLATVASRTGGTPELVGDAGLIFDSEDVPQLAAHLRTLILDPELRARYAQKARSRAQEFTWDRTWANLVELSTAVER